MFGQSLGPRKESEFLRSLPPGSTSRGRRIFKPTRLQQLWKGSLPPISTQVQESPTQRKRKLSSEGKREESVKKKKTYGRARIDQLKLNISIFLNLPLVFPSLTESYNSIIVQQLQQLSVAIISIEIAKSNRLAGRLSLFRSNWEKICNDRWVLDAIQDYHIEWLTKPYQVHQPACPHFSEEEMESLQIEIEQNDLERGDLTSKDWDRGRHPLHHNIPSPQERWGPQNNYQPEEVEQFGPAPSFQDGGDTHAKRPVEARRLHGQDRLERRLSCSANKQARQEIPEVQMETSNVSVQLPTFWAVICAPWVFTKITKAVAAVLREMDVRLIMYVDNMLIMETMLRNSLSPRESRICDQLPQVTSGASEEHRLSGVPDRFSIHGTQASGREDQEYQSRGQEGVGD